MERKTARRRIWRLALVGPVLVLVAAATLVTQPATATQGFCGQTWGSLPKQLGNNDPGSQSSVLTNVRAGRHECYDRLVFDLSGPATGYRVEYVSQVTNEDTGAPIPIRGGAILGIVLSAPAHDGNYQPTYQPANRFEAVNVSGFSTFRQVYFGGTFEGLTDSALGVRARLPFRVTVLSGPGTGSRVALDVAHFW